jgi:hypothetical protein
MISTNFIIVLIFFLIQINTLNYLLNLNKVELSTIVTNYKTKNLLELFYLGTN